jgi:branched-chain amino acid transport system permease protein
VAELLQHLANGVVLGASYALIAVGLTLVYGILEVINFAHGELYMAGAYAVFVATVVGLPYGLAAAVAVLAIGALGAVVYRLAIRPTLGRSYESAILATLAVSIIVQNGARLVWTATPREVESRLALHVIELGPVAVTAQQLLAIAVAAAAFAGLQLLIFRTRIGRAIRACAQSRDGCLMVGVDVPRVAAVTVVLGAALAGLAGVIMAPIYNIAPTIGTGAVFKAFAVVIIGGMGNVVGAAVVGLGLGLVESLVGGYASLTMRDAVGFLGMITVLLLRPHGLFARRVRA